MTQFRTVTKGRSKGRVLTLEQLQLARMRKRRKINELMNRLRDIQKQESKTKEELSVPFTLDKPGEFMAQLALQGDKETTREKATTTVYFPQTDTLYTLDTVYTENQNGTAGRILLDGSHLKRGEGRFGPAVDKDINYKPSAGLVWRTINGKPTIVAIETEKEMRGRGLATLLLKKFEKKFGVVRGTGVFSKRGAKLAERYQGKVEVVKN